MIFDTPAAGIVGEVPNDHLRRLERAIAVV